MKITLSKYVEYISEAMLRDKFIASMLTLENKKCFKYETRKRQNKHKVNRKTEILWEKSKLNKI